jgi:Polysaccharide lyase
MKKITGLIAVVIVVLLFGCSKREIEYKANTKDSAAGAADFSIATDRLISFENSTFAGNYDLTESGIVYRFIKKGTFYAPPVIAGNAYSGHNCIQYQVAGSTAQGGETTDKSQHRIFSGSDANALTFGAKKYFGFAMKIGTNMPQPSNTVQFFQIWQGTPMSPPLEVRLKPGGSGNTFNFEVWIRNNSTTANPSSGIQVYQGTIQRGQWNTFVLMTIMRNTNDSQNGQIKLWLNGTQVKDWTGRAGYSGGIVYAGSSYTPNANFDAFFGPYRPCQQLVLNMYFDQVKYAGAYADAIP